MVDALKQEIILGDIVFYTNNAEMLYFLIIEGTETLGGRIRILEFNSYKEYYTPPLIGHVDKRDIIKVSEEQVRHAAHTAFANKPEWLEQTLLVIEKSREIKEQNQIRLWT